MLLGVYTKGGAQELSRPMTELMGICIDLSNGLKNYSDQNISDANESFRRFRMKNPIGALPLKNIKAGDSPVESGENVVFLPEFFDRLLENDQAYEMAMTLRSRFEWNKGQKKVVKGSKRQYDIYQKDFFIGSGENISFDVECPSAEFEIIAVASPGGLFNMSVYDYSQKEYWNDTEKERSGSESRQRHIDGKKNGKYKVSLQNMVGGSYTIAVFCKL